VQPHERGVQGKRHGTLEKIERRKLLALCESEVEYRTRIVWSILIVVRSNLEVSSEHLRDREPERLETSQKRVLVLIRDELSGALRSSSTMRGPYAATHAEAKVSSEKSALILFLFF
jgi:hypothetical protein